jgi:hypothetical protein
MNGRRGENVSMTADVTMNEDKSRPVRTAAAKALLALVASAACAGCVAPNTTVHRVSVDVQARPKDLRACVAEAIRGVDGVPGLNPQPQGIEASVVSFRTTLPDVTGVVERQDADGLRVSIEVMAFVEPANFWEFGQSRTKTIADAIVERCGDL